MTGLATKYLGLTLPSPLVASSSPLTGDLSQAMALADAGIGAIILPSLFEEQLTLRQTGMAYYLTHNRDALPESLRHIPDMEGYNQGVNGYLAYIAELKDNLEIPIIASLNGSSSGGWVHYARILEAAGADAIELNVYYLPTEVHVSGAETEARYLKLVAEVRESVQIPIAIKLSPYFTAIANFAFKLEEAGADGLVLFNRFYQPDFDLNDLSLVPSLSLSTSDELRLRLRWVAILHSQLQADLAITGGVHNADDAAKAILAGARVAMMASALLRNGAGHVATVLEGLETWMAAHKIESIDRMRLWGSQHHIAPNRAALERANYMQVLQEGKKSLGKSQ